MDEFFSDNFFDNPAPIGWSEHDWFAYLKKSEAEISRFASIYSLNRAKGKSLDEISQLAGWQIPLNDDEDIDEDEDSEFAEEPWTLLNHPVYIITRGLLKCLEEHLGRVIEETQIPPMHVWELSKIITQISTFISMGVNSTDLGEDLLARCNYKMTALRLNAFIAKISEIPAPHSEQGSERMKRITNVIFDLRELCLNLAESSAIGKK